MPFTPFRRGTLVFNAMPAADDVCGAAVVFISWCVSTTKEQRHGQARCESCSGELVGPGHSSEREQRCCCDRSAHSRRVGRQQHPWKTQQ